MFYGEYISQMRNVLGALQARLDDGSVEFIDESVADGNMVKTLYYANGDIRTEIKDSQGRKLSDVRKDSKGKIETRIEYLYYENGQVAHNIFFGRIYTGLFDTEAKWREDGQLVFKKRNNFITECQFYDEGSIKEEHIYSPTYNEICRYHPNGKLAYKAVERENEKYYSEHYDNGVIKEEERRDENNKVTYRCEKDYNGTLKYLKRDSRRDGYTEEIYNDKGILVRKERRGGGGFNEPYKSVKCFFDDGTLHKDSYWTHSFEYGDLYHEKECDEQGRVICEDSDWCRCEVIYDGAKGIATFKKDWEREGCHQHLLYDKLRTLSLFSYCKDGYRLTTPENKDYYPDGSEIKCVFDGDKLGNMTVKNSRGEIIGERIVEYYENGQYCKVDEYITDRKGEFLKRSFSYYEDGKLKSKFAKKGNYEQSCEYDKDGFLVSRLEKCGSKIMQDFQCTTDGDYNYYYFLGDEHVIIEKSGNEVKETKHVVKSNGRIVKETTTTTYSQKRYHESYDEKIIYPGSFREETKRVRNGHKVFEQEIGFWGKLVSLTEYYPHGEKKREIKTNEEGSQVETHWDETGNRIFYKKQSLNGECSHKCLYPSGRVELESVKGGVIIYWDTDRNNIKEKRDIKYNITYSEYDNGQKCFELHENGSPTKWYKTGEVLSQKDEKGKEIFYYKDGKERMVVEADGSKNVNYDGEQFLLIAGRHCDKYGEDGGLTEIGEKQATNIGRFIAYASQGKIAGVPNVVLPEVYSTSNNSRSENTVGFIVKSINSVLSQDIKPEKVNGKHSAISELSIHSLFDGYDTADNNMGSIAFSVVGRDGLVIDRVVFTAEQIAEQLARVEEQEKTMQETKSKIKKFKEETLEKGKTKSKIALLREVLKDNVSEDKGVVNPKRSKADKDAIRAALKEASSKIKT